MDQSPMTQNTGKQFLSLTEGILVGFAVLAVIVGVFMFLNRPQPNQSPNATPTQPPVTQTNTTVPSTVIALVGQEKIYQSDLDMEQTYAPPMKNTNLKQFLLNKIIRDSIILQGAADDKLITLDSTVFNSPTKEYLKRIELVKKAESLVNKQTDTISGSLVSIWFFNVLPAPMGYDKGRALALSTITPLYNDVKSKKLTMQQAGQKISGDTKLAQVDPSYKANAILNFDAQPNKPITFDPAFDAIIRKLQVGEITPLYLAKDKDHATGKTVDAVYMFAQISKKNGGTTTDFKQWYDQKQKAYAVTRY